MKGKKDEILTGIFIANPRGYGFVEVEGETEDYFIPRKYCRGAFHKDIVKIEQLQKARGKKREAKIVEVVGHGLGEVVGTFEKSANFGFVIPEDTKIARDIFIPKGMDMDAGGGAKVVCRILDYDEQFKNPTGEIIEIIGRYLEPHVDIIALARAFDMPMDFPEEVREESAEIDTNVSRQMMKNRLDLRDEQIITIDGDDSKDFDDAVSLVRTREGYRLGVHIADVTHYVKEKTPLDKEAAKRGTSVYLPGVVIPMLPEKLSNGVCSLVEGQDRLTLSCIMDIDGSGRITDSVIRPSVIRSSRRMTYSRVNNILADTDCEDAIRERELMPMLFLMRELSGVLFAKRRKRGAIEMDIPEPSVVLDKRGKCIDLKKRGRGTAEHIIEEFMLAANETVAEYFYNMGVPFVYRNHPAPELEKIKELSELAALFGVNIKVERTKVRPKQIAQLIEKTKGSVQETLISICTLRSMQQAKYSTTGHDHFGLASEYYCHFTSPIRRYPDLLVHRIIKECLSKGLSARRFSHYERILPALAEHSSKQERKAIECEREANKLKMAEYMKQHIGRDFTGFVSGVTSWGMYVQLDNTAEGMIPIHAIGRGYYDYFEKEYCIRGGVPYEAFRLGDPIRVVVHEVNMDSRSIEFRIKRDDKDKG